MTQQKKVEITRHQDIVVASVQANSFGDLEFTDTEGGNYKIGAKRVSYFKDVLISDRAVRLNYVMSSFGKEYIYNAIPAEQLVRAKEPVPEIPKTGKIIPKSDDRNKSFTLACAKDLAVADKIKVKEIISYATVFDMYLRGDFEESESEIIAKYIAKYGRKEEVAKLKN